MAYRTIIIAITLLLSKDIYAQHEDARWVLGTYAQLYFCDTNIVNPKYEDGKFDLIVGFNNASICNKASGELLIFCHGSIIFNKLGVPMENGDSINVGKYSWDGYPSDIITWEGVSILPFPNHDNLYYVIYTNADSINKGGYLASNLYYSIVDMTYNNGLGKVVQKDIPILNRWLENGRINAIQHANGRDWWITVNGHNDSKHYVFLLDANGIKLYNTQTIGLPYDLVSTVDNTQTCVNQSGTQIVYSYSTFDVTHIHRLDFYDFDRCSGLLSNYYTIPFTDSLPIVGCAFSPNDSLLYVNNIFHLYQYNVKNKIDSIQIPIDTFDIAFQDPTYILFGQQKLASDNKIYMPTWGGTRRLQCITKPNIRGIGCDFKQGYIRSDSQFHYFRGSVPNYPNFRLGVLKGSDCDTIREVKPPLVSDGLFIYPNPSNEWLMLNGKWLMGSTNVVVYNMIGQKELSFTFQNSKGIESINVLALANGIYILQIIDEAGTKHNCKFVKQ
ncbi:MAG: hypothetical protein RJA07_697 [Bacteroidota bacterium]|jgi:hypothetical protein